ncbi:MAG: hypothetical protein IPJ04_02220 [Candidatus Eisenbacteria bacterium]|nr:hypothetical protein [Candidatus Eisenbacteria bacterium]
MSAIAPRRLVLYEDRHWRTLRPMTDLLPVPALTFGASDLARRWMRAAGVPLFAIEARAYALACWHHAPVPDTSAVDPSTEALVVNAAAMPGPWFAAALEGRSPALWMGEGRIAGALVPLALLRNAIGKGEAFEQMLLGMGLPTMAVDAPFLNYPWQMLEWNADAIHSDLADAKPGNHGDVHALACLIAPERITIARGAKVGPYAVLDASAGPIYVAHGASIAPHTAVTGPCVIGGGTQLLGGFVSGTTFGPGVPRRGRGRGERLAGLRQQAPPRLPRALARRGVGEPRRAHDHQRPQEQLRLGPRARGPDRHGQRQQQGRLAHRIAREDRHRHAAPDGGQRRHRRQPVRGRTLRSQVHAGVRLVGRGAYGRSRVAEVHGHGPHRHVPPLPDLRPCRGERGHRTFRLDRGRAPSDDRGVLKPSRPPVPQA